MSRLACLLALAGVASAQLTLDGIRCGQLTCQLDEYCSSETNRCASCAIVCNKTHHNYDTGLCIKECQGYLLDLRYMRRSEDNPVSDYSAAGRLLLDDGLPRIFATTGFAPLAASDLPRPLCIQRQARAAVIVSSVALALLVLVLIFVCRSKFSWRYLKQKFQPAKNRVKQYPAGITHHNPHAEIPKARDLKLEIRNPEPPQRSQQPLNARDLETRTSQTDKSQGATTPKTISTALSNRHPAEDTTLDFSYDNMAMNVTPPEANHKF